MKGKGREWDESQQQPRLSVADTTNTPHALALSFFFKHVIVWDKQIRQSVQVMRRTDGPKSVTITPFLNFKVIR